MDDLPVAEGSRMHRDILYLKHHWGLFTEWDTFERAVRLMAEISQRLSQRSEVRLGGGPPYDALRWTPVAPGRSIRPDGHDADVAEMQRVFTSKPHGEQAVYLVEDHADPAQRIYEIHDSRGNATPLLGSEMDSLCAWWAKERNRIRSS